MAPRCTMYSGPERAICSLWIKRVCDGMASNIALASKPFGQTTNLYVLKTKNEESFFFKIHEIVFVNFKKFLLPGNYVIS